MNSKKILSQVAQMKDLAATLMNKAISIEEMLTVGGKTTVSTRKGRNMQSLANLHKTMFKKPVK